MRNAQRWLSNNSMQRTALRAAADAERYTALTFGEGAAKIFYQRLKIMSKTSSLYAEIWEDSQWELIPKSK